MLTQNVCCVRIYRQSLTWSPGRRPTWLINLSCVRNWVTDGFRPSCEQWVGYFGPEVVTCRSRVWSCAGVGEGCVQTTVGGARWVGLGGSGGGGRGVGPGDTGGDTEPLFCSLCRCVSRRFSRKSVGERNTVDKTVTTLHWACKLKIVFLFYLTVVWVMTM